jgi:hypothetical protein
MSARALGADRRMVIRQVKRAAACQPGSSGRGRWA